MCTVTFSGVPLYSGTSSRLQQGPTHVTDTGRCPMPCPNPTEVARLGQLSLCCSRSGASPSSRDCLVLIPVLWLSRAAVCAATKLLVCCSQDLFNLRTPSVFRPDQRGEPVVTLWPYTVLRPPMAYSHAPVAYHHLSPSSHGLQSYAHSLLPLSCGPPFYTRNLAPCARGPLLYFHGLLLDTRGLLLYACGPLSYACGPLLYTHDLPLYACGLLLYARGLPSYTHSIP